MSRFVPWDEDMHHENELWVCPYCDAHCHADCVGDSCPACGSGLEVFDYND